MDWDYDIPDADARPSMAMAFSGDGSLYLADSTGLYRHAPDGTMWENVMEGGTCSLGLPDFSVGILTVADGEHDTIVARGYGGGGSGVLRYVFDAEASQTTGTELNIFSLEANETVQRAVVEFNRSQTDVRANYTAAMTTGGGTAQDYIKTLNTELLAGNGPDVILLDGLPMDSYIEKDVLMDITAIADGAEPILPNVRKAYAADGKLYGVPLGVKAPIALSKGDADMFDSLGQLAEQAEPPLSSIAFSYESLARWLLSHYNEGLYSGEPEAVNAFMSQAKKLSDLIGATDRLGEGWESGMGGERTQQQIREEFLRNNEAPQYYALIKNMATAAVLEATSVDKFLMASALIDEYGVNLGGIGNKFIGVGLVGVNKASANQEAAAEFLRTALGNNVQQATNFRSEFPVNEAALDAAIEHEEEAFGVSLALGETESLVGSWPTETTRKKLKDIIKTASVPIQRDAVLDEMLLPEIIAVLDGSVAPQAGADKVGNLLKTYLSE